jgi:MFS family permease
MGVEQRTGTGQFALLCGATLFEFVSLGIYLSALPLFVTDSLGGSRAGVGLTMGAFSVAAVLLRPLVGQGLDRRGRRPFLMGAPAILLVTSLGFTAVGSLGAAVVLRLVQGTAGACFYTAAATVATDLAPPERRADFLARFSLFLYGGFAIGPSLGEALVRRGYDWVEELLSPATVRRHGVFDPDAVSRLAGQYRQKGFELHPHLEVDLLIVVLTLHLLCETFEMRGVA